MPNVKYIQHHTKPGDRHVLGSPHLMEATLRGDFENWYLCVINENLIHLRGFVHTKDPDPWPPGTVPSWKDDEGGTNGHSPHSVEAPPLSVRRKAEPPKEIEADVEGPVEETLYQFSGGKWNKYWDLTEAAERSNSKIAFNKWLRQNEFLARVRGEESVAIKVPENPFCTLEEMQARYVAQPDLLGSVNKWLKLQRDIEREEEVIRTKTTDWRATAWKEPHRMGDELAWLFARRLWTLSARCRLAEEHNQLQAQFDKEETTMDVSEAETALLDGIRQMGLLDMPTPSANGGRKRKAKVAK